MRTSIKKAKKIVIPRVPSERAEADWFYKNRRLLEADMTRRLKGGETKTLAQALRQSAAREKSRLKPITIRMLPDDLALVRRLAIEKGLPYQTFVKVLLREALRRETRKSA
jgi:predicted DNA binding CopG/RHH family protein